MTLETLGKLNGKKVDVLGEKYTIRIVKADKDSENVIAKRLAVDEAAMETAFPQKEIWVDIDNYTDDDFTESRSIDEDLTHELYHAFLFESGLDNCTYLGQGEVWARNETMVDWCAKQFHKILIARRQLGIKDEF